MSISDTKTYLCGLKDSTYEKYRVLEQSLIRTDQSRRKASFWSFERPDGRRAPVGRWYGTGRALVRHW